MSATTNCVALNTQYYTDDLNGVSTDDPGVKYGCYTSNSLNCMRTYPHTECGDVENGYIAALGDTNNTPGDPVGWSSSSGLPTKGSPAMNHYYFVTPNNDKDAYPTHLYTQACWGESNFPGTDANSADASIADVCRSEFGPEFGSYNVSNSHCDSVYNWSNMDQPFGNNDYTWTGGEPDDVVVTSGGGCAVVGQKGKRGCASGQRAAVCKLNDPLGLDPAYADPTGCCVDGQPWTNANDFTRTGSLYATWLRCPYKAVNGACTPTSTQLPSPDTCASCTPYIARFIAAENDPRQPGMSVYADSRVRQWISKQCTADLAALDPNRPPAGYTSDEVAAAQQWCVNAGIGMSQYCYNSDTCSDITSVNPDAFFNKLCVGVQAENTYTDPSACASGTGSKDYGTPKCICSCINSPMMAGMASTKAVCYDTNCSAGGYIPSSQMGNSDCPNNMTCNQNWINVGSGNASLQNQMNQTCNADGSTTTVDETDTSGSSGSGSGSSGGSGGDSSDSSDGSDDTTTSSYQWLMIALALVFVLLILGGIFAALFKKGGSQAPAKRSNPTEVSIKL